MKSFLLTIGKAAGSSLPTILSVLSAGAALPVTDLNILHIADAEPDPVIPALTEDLNKAHRLFASAENETLFPSSFIYETCRPLLPTIRSLSTDSASSALISALRGQGIPLSYRTDREAVEWAFSALLSSEDSSLSPFFQWAEKIARGENPDRLAVLCDLCDPFSAGAAFSLLRYCHERLSLPSSMVSLFCMACKSDASPESEQIILSGSVQAIDRQQLIAGADGSGPACADSAWFMSLPASMIRSEDSYRVLFVSLARKLAVFFSRDTLPAPGLHTADLPGIITFQSLGDQAKSFVSFLHTSVWLLSDLFPALSVFFERSAPLRSLTPNTRSGLFKRLFRQSGPAGLPDEVSLFDRVFRAVLSELLNLIRHMPDQLRLAEVSDPLWKEAVDACGRTVTVAAEYDVSLAEAEESGIMKIKPVHRVSLSDTEEEKQLRRLDEISAQLEEETERRRLVFEKIGGSRARLALSDCRERCRSALQRAGESVSELSADPQADHLAVAAAVRRVSLLTAAVARCEKDLSDPDLLRIASGEAGASALNLSPFASQLLTASAAEKLAALLTVSSDESEAVRKELRALMPSLLYGFELADGKTLLRNLLTFCKPDAALQPLINLILSANRVSMNEVSGLRFLSAGEVPPIPLLPDLYPSRPLVSVSALPPLLAAGDASAGMTAEEKRGLLAFLLLRQYRRRTSEEASLALDEYHSDDSPVLHAWLAGHQAERLCMFSLVSGEIRFPVAIILPGKDLISARLSEQQLAMIPSFAEPWLDRDSLRFRDPCSLISEGDCLLLEDRLDRMMEALPSGLPLRSFLSEFRHTLQSENEQASLPENLSLLLKACFGLRLLPAFSQTLDRSVCHYEHFLPDDAVSACLTGQASFLPSACNIPDDIIYLYRGVPFTREDSRTLLSSIPLPAQDWILSILRQDSKVLSASSDLYHDALVRELSLLLERCPSAVPEARQKAFDLLEKANLPVADSVTELTWPWDVSSPAILTILTESLGEKLASAAVHPFSDVLAFFPARGKEIIGDSLMSSMCVLNPDVPVSEDGVPPSVQADAVLPPLSGELTAALCRLPEGRVLLRPGLLVFSRKNEGSVQVTLTLDGRFPVRLVRMYAENELVHLYSHDIPTLAVWPNLPFSSEDWHAYYIYASLPAECRLTCYRSEDETGLSADESGRLVSCSASFPVAFSLSRDGQSFGSVPNLLPPPDVRKEEAAIACVDFGSVGTSVVFSSGRQRRPLHGPTLVRTLLNNPACSRDLLRKEFLPAVPVSALLPTASRIFRNVPGSDPLPFEDGIVLMSSNLQDVLSIPSDALYTSLKWEEEKGRSTMLCLHQVMLMTALQARVDGIGKLTWRFALPDEMGKEGRERLMELFVSLAEKVSGTAGYPLPEAEPLVTFAAESSALGAYFRLCSAEDTRGGFMVLDIGACTADISLFLRGREQAVRTCQIPLGVHYMLLPVLLRDPSLLRRELGTVQDPGFLQDLSLLEQILNSARSDTAALRKARLALDSFIADRRPVLLPALLFNPASGMPTRLGSVLLLHFSYLMMLSGLVLLQIAADPGKNDFLPEQMSLCLSGRGSILLEDLPDPYKTGLWHFLTMFRNRRVASLSLLFSSEKKMEIPAGLSVLQVVSADLPAASAVPAAISVRPEELLPQFLLRFRKEYPACAEILFGGFYTNDFYHPFTPYGESLVSAAISQSFTEQTALRPFDALSGWIGSLLELVNTPA